MIRITRMTIVTITFMLCLTSLVLSGMAFGGGGGQCVDNGDGTVKDNGTGLMWQQATAGPMNWDAAMSYANNLSLGGHSGWWLPSKDELTGLYDSPCKSMMQVQPTRYWSSTTYAYDTDLAWTVDFYLGMGILHKSDSYYVRAVRAGQ